MREKDKPLKISNPVSKRIVSGLLKRNGNDKLYDLCRSINAHQGSIRRRLEAKDKSWAVAEDLYNISKYLNVDIEWIITGKSKNSESNRENQKWMNLALNYEKQMKKLEKTNTKLKTALILLKDIDR